MSNMNTQLRRRRQKRRRRRRRTQASPHFLWTRMLLMLLCMIMVLSTIPVVMAQQQQQQQPQQLQQQQPPNLGISNNSIVNTTSSNSKDTGDNAVRDGFISIAFSTGIDDPNTVDEDDTDNEDDSRIKNSTSSSFIKVDDSVVFQALQDFFCDDTDIILVNKNYRSVCAIVGGGGGDILSGISSSSSINQNGDSATTTTATTSPAAARTSIADFLAETKEEQSYLLNEIVDVTITPIRQQQQQQQQPAANADGGSGSDGTVLQWRTWTIVYSVVYLGTTLRQQATMMNVDNVEDFMESVVQLALDVSIMEGIMDARTGVPMSMVGLEAETFGGGGFDSGEEQSLNPDSYSNITATRAQEFQQRADILRWVGAGLFGMSAILVLLLTRLGKRQRRKQEEEDALLSDQDVCSSIPERGLGTEKDVDLMLDVSRKDLSFSFSRPFFSPSLEENAASPGAGEVGTRPSNSTSRNQGGETPGQKNEVTDFFQGLFSVAGDFFTGTTGSSGR